MDTEVSVWNVGRSAAIAPFPRSGWRVRARLNRSAVPANANKNDPTRPIFPLFFSFLFFNFTVSSCSNVHVHDYSTNEDDRHCQATSREKHAPDAPRTSEAFRPNTTASDDRLNCKLRWGALQAPPPAHERLQRGARGAAQRPMASPSNSFF